MPTFSLLSQLRRTLLITNFQFRTLLPLSASPNPRPRCSGFSTCSEEDPKMVDLLEYLDKLKNYERSGVPKGAGTDSGEGFDLGRMRRLLDRLGNPQSKFKAVHVAGTKGKGSTVAFLANILREEGYSVGCYTSPHLQTIRERISFGKKGDLISPEALNNLFLRVRSILDQSVQKENGSLSHFEIFTALSFVFFAEENVDIAVVEAGLGGARDATNVLSSSDLIASVITTVGVEHLAALGGSLEGIAEAKSGIIKEGRPVVIGGPFEPHIESILRRKACALGSPVISASDPGIRSSIQCMRKADGDIFQLCDLVIHVQKDIKLFLELNNVKVHMLGMHQLRNVMTATCTALCLREEGWSVSDQSICAGIEKTRLLGRSQLMTEREVKALGLSGLSILIDGAHTEGSAKALADTIRMMRQCGSLALVVAMACDKDHVAFAKQLLLGAKPEVVVLTEVSIAGGNSRMTPATSLKDVWSGAAEELGIDVVMEVKNCDDENIYSSSLRNPRNGAVSAECQIENIIESLKLASQLLMSRTKEQPGLIVVTGSLHIVSSLLSSFCRQDKIFPRISIATALVPICGRQSLSITTVFVAKSGNLAVPSGAAAGVDKDTEKEGEDGGGSQSQQLEGGGARLTGGRGSKASHVSSLVPSRGTPRPRGKPSGAEGRPPPRPAGLGS